MLAKPALMANQCKTHLQDFLRLCVPGLCRIRLDLVELGVTEKVAHRLSSEVVPFRDLVG